MLMKKNLSIFIFLILNISLTAQELKVMTYNIRYATVNDGENQWEKRKEFVSSQLRFFAPDIFGIQEGLERQVDYLKEKLEKYDYVGVGRDDGKSKGEYCAIFYQKEKFSLLHQGTFWLSETPDEVSKGWDAAFERICTYAYFQDKNTGTYFWVFNTHFDHKGVLAREKSAHLIVEKIHEINVYKAPVFLFGDFNLNENSATVRYLSDNFQEARSSSVEKPFGPFGTFNNFAFDQPVQDRIDYIFCSPEIITVEKYGVLTDAKDRRYPSDHFPVLIKASIEK